MPSLKGLTKGSKECYAGQRAQNKWRLLYDAKYQLIVKKRRKNRRKRANELARVKYHRTGGCNSLVRKAGAARYRVKHKKKISVYFNRWYQANKTRLIERARVRNNARYKNDPLYRMKCVLATSVNAHLKRYNKTKNNRTLEYVGTTLQVLREHLEQQFPQEMNWNNYGSFWHIDHIIPFNEFKKHGLDYRLCSHFTNLQPLPAKENTALKSDQIVKPYLHKIIAHPGSPDELLDIALALLSY